MIGLGPQSRGTVRAMPRPASSQTGRVTVDLDEKVKMRAGLYAFKRGITLTRLIEQALVAYMARPSSKPEPAPARRPRKGERLPSTAPALPGLYEPTGGSVQGEPEDVHERQPERTG